LKKKKIWLYLHIIEHSFLWTWCCYPVSTEISCRSARQLCYSSWRHNTRLKNYLFHWLRVDSYFWKTTTLGLYTVNFQIKNFAGCDTSYMNGHFQKSIIGAL